EWGVMLKSYWDAASQSYHARSVSVVGTTSNLNITDRDQGGNIAWSRNIKKTGYQYWAVSEMIIDENGNTILAGSVYNLTELRYEIFTLKVGSVGNLGWSTFFSAEANY